jgi:PhnB protein
MTKIEPIPRDHSPVLFYLVVKDAPRAIEFYKAAFGAAEAFRLTEPSGKVGHAELSINGGMFMLADEYPDFGALAPPSVGGCPVKLHVYVSDVDAAVARAVAAGATLVRAAKNEFYGDRAATVADPFGYSWSLHSRVENVTPQEMQRRWSEMMGG